MEARFINQHRTKHNLMTLLRQIRTCKDISELNDLLSEFFTDYLESFSEEDGMIRKIEEEEQDVCEGWEFVYTYKGADLAYKMIGRLHNIAGYFFPNDTLHIDIYSHLFQEP